MGPNKGILKKNYHVIPPKKIMIFVREIEFKIKLRNMTNEDKIKYFFDCFETVNCVDDKDVFYEDNLFIKDYFEIDSIEEDDEEDSESL